MIQLNYLDLVTMNQLLTDKINTFELRIKHAKEAGSDNYNSYNKETIALTKLKCKINGLSKQYNTISREY